MELLIGYACMNYMDMDGNDMHIEEQQSPPSSSIYPHPSHLGPASVPGTCRIFFVLSLEIDVMHNLLCL